jgi:hypothetical protein
MEDPPEMVGKAPSILGCLSGVVVGYGMDQPSGRVISFDGVKGT